MVSLRGWQGSADTTVVQQLVSRLWPYSSHPGGLGWEAATDQLPSETILAEDGGILGWAGATSGELLVQARPEAARPLLDWAMTTAEGSDLVIPVFDGDEVLRSLVIEAGFQRAGRAAPLVGMFRAATPEFPQLPAGYRIRGTHSAEAAERVAVHRAAWRPMTLPWAEGVARTVSPDATSSFTAAHFESLRRTWLYDQELDLVVEAPDGSLAGCCTVWWDPAIGCAEIEPLGVVPEHRRKGLAGALCLEACAQIAARGGDRVFINTGPRADYPAPAATYASVGFVATARAHFYGFSSRRS